MPSGPAADRMVQPPEAGRTVSVEPASGAPSRRRTRPVSRGARPKPTARACAVTRPAAGSQPTGGGGGGGGGCISFQPSQPFWGPRPAS